MWNYSKQCFWPILPRLCVTQTSRSAVGHSNEIKWGHLRSAWRTRKATRVTATWARVSFAQLPRAFPLRQGSTRTHSPSSGLSVLRQWILPWLFSAEQRHFSRAGRGAAWRCGPGTAPAGAFAPSRQPGSLRVSQDIGGGAARPVENTALTTRGHSNRGLSAS